MQCFESPFEIPNLYDDIQISRLNGGTNDDKDDSDCINANTAHQELPDTQTCILAQELSHRWLKMQRNELCVFRYLLRVLHIHFFIGLLLAGDKKPNAFLHVVSETMLRMDRFATVIRRRKVVRTAQKLMFAYFVLADSINRQLSINSL